MDINLFFYGTLTALVYVILQSLFIIGVRAAAKGGTEILPDGTEKDSEMILYPIFKYLTRVKRNKVYYKGNQFTNLMDSIRQNSDMEVIYDDWQMKIRAKGTASLTQLEELKDIVRKINSKIQIEVQNNTINFFQMDEEYVFSKYLRKPIIQCPICMSSFWSIFTYWIPMIYVFGFSLELFYLGAMNICAVACLNWLIWVKGHANEVIAKGR